MDPEHPLHSVSLPTSSSSCKLLTWSVQPGDRVRKGTILCSYLSGSEGDQGRLQLKSTLVGVVRELLVQDGDSVQPGTPVVLLEEKCDHSIVVFDMCADCGFNLRSHPSTRTASVSMIPGIPEIRISQKEAEVLGNKDKVRLLESKKLALVVDLDQTLIHTSVDPNIEPGLPDVYGFHLRGYPVTYHCRLRPYARDFLEKVSKYYEMHVFTMGTKSYAANIIPILDPERRFFCDRIISRDEFFDPTSKALRLKSVFPCGDSMVAIIDDREDVWRNCPNLVHVKPYVFFAGTADINAPPSRPPPTPSPQSPPQSQSSGFPPPHMPFKTRHMSRTSESGIRRNNDMRQLRRAISVDSRIPENKQSMDLDSTNGSGKMTALRSLLLATQVSNKSTSDHTSTDPCTGEQQDVQSQPVNALKESSDHPKSTELQDHSVSNDTGACNDSGNTEADKEAVEDEQGADDNKNSSSSSSSSSSSDSEDSSSGSSGIDDTLFENLGKEEGEQERGESEMKLMQEGEDEIEEGEKEGRGGLEGGEEQGKRDLESGEEKEQLLAQGEIGRDASVTIATQEVQQERGGVESGKQIVAQELQAGGGQVIAQEEREGGEVMAREEKEGGQVIVQDEREGGQTQPNEDGEKMDASPVVTPGEMETTQDNTKASDSSTGKDDSNVLNKQSEQRRIPVIHDPDDFLLHLGNILERIHARFYTQYDRMRKKDGSSMALADVPTPDLKEIIPKMRQSVLKGAKVLFTGVIPTNLPPEKSPEWNTARAFGAAVHDRLVPGLNGSNPKQVLRATTHLIASKPGTSKLREAKKITGLKIVHPKWLWSCAERWKWMDERLFPLSGELKKEEKTKIEEPKKKLRRVEAPKDSEKTQQEYERHLSIESRLSVSDEELERMEAEVDAELGSSSSESDKEEELGTFIRSTKEDNELSYEHHTGDVFTEGDQVAPRKRKHADVEESGSSNSPSSNNSLENIKAVEQSDDSSSSSEESGDELAMLLDVASGSESD